MNTPTQSTNGKAAELSRLCADAANEKPLPSLPERLLTLKEVGEILQLSRVSVWRLHAERSLRVCRCGRAIRVKPEDLRAWIEKNSTEGGAS
jgi:excisionase family DNA binding protein